MAKKFNGTIALDIRDSVPDWEPYAEPKAPEGSPNILYLVIDDTGFGAWEMFGGKIKMPNLDRIAKKGLIYTNFHTTALCSPTRSSLLNGRNATSNGMSCIEEATTGFPGNNGRIPFENAMIPAVLSERGWCTFALGKWHLLPEEEANMAASKRHWPLGRGFERYYGFLGGETDQWYPDLVYDNHLIEPPYGPDMEDTENGYHLSKDLVDKAISFIQDTTAIAPNKPWMMYFSPGANHAPHQIWPQKILDYEYNTILDYSDNPKDVSFEITSVFSEGYEKYREDVLAKMKELGIFGDEVTEPSKINPHGEGELAQDNPDHTKIEGVPEGKKWPQTDWVRPWDGLEKQEKALFVRMAEIYAAFSTYTDEQIGRLLDFLEETGQMDNTIIIAVADNGASAEGGPNGSVNENLFFNDVPDDFDKNFALLQDLGTLKTYNHYPSGWAWGFDTPFKYWKRWSGYEGGAATPFMICGPGIKESRVADTGIRKQYIHAVDLVPTLYEMCGVEPPDVVKGYTQNPIEGISFAYTFDPQYAQPEYQFAYKLSDEQKPKDEQGKPKKVRETQFYSMLGTRGVWYKGWHANTVHAPAPSDWSNFEKDIWELYCMDGDEEVTYSRR
ncbi:sulfatase-like hydrolase/transferase [Crocosphaera sp. XPORK-15E]|uniref:sulfatase-like hydrolase/transferase n=1 Tax=Crocosphaera sp. XPORK-15E TaxID=3110247 RepID=UPI002B20A125|nr:sulfatase-like hydrolase/transferase [Crocosphaera sp. XPORK-15E]MEA5534666.1 sulfatase-like hydrolase/transferase [Crocosphaera sp. XPORK-15E]